MSVDAPSTTLPPDNGRVVRHTLAWMVVSSMLFAIVMLVIMLYRPEGIWPEKKS